MKVCPCLSGTCCILDMVLQNDMAVFVEKLEAMSAALKTEMLRECLEILKGTRDGTGLFKLRIPASQMLLSRGFSRKYVGENVQAAFGTAHTEGLILPIGDGKKRCLIQQLIL